LRVLGERRNPFGSTGRSGPSSPGGALPLTKRYLKQSILSWESCSARAASRHPIAFAERRSIDLPHTFREPGDPESRGIRAASEDGV